MTDDEINRLHDMALGHALYAATLAEILFIRIAKTMEPDEAAELIDRALLVLEKNQVLVQGGPGAVEYARSRLEGLLRAYRAKRS